MTPTHSKLPPHIPLQALDQISSKILGKGAWLMLEESSYMLPAHDGQAAQLRRWEVCRRKRDEKIRVGGMVDGVDILAILLSPNCSPRCVLVLQYRPALLAYTLEFPSGLIDPGENPAEAACRELKEETGYTGEVVSISEPVPYEPGMSDSCSCFVKMTIDITLPENLNPVPLLEADEWSLQRVEVPMNDLLDVIHEFQRTYSSLIRIDSRLYTFALALNSSLIQ
ncbi:uncharacterized protein VTP21DRAFT_7201 [Calcarisporiella thermophila]|uniref:uncharacterized protein n=1 Tax=Calcarisporiella thermophila TaxID=911321 RepID=UPI00374495FA